MPNQRVMLYDLRKRTGVALSRSFQQYTVAVLKQELTELNVDFSGILPPEPVPAPEQEEAAYHSENMQAYESMPDLQLPDPDPEPAPPEYMDATPTKVPPPRQDQADPNEMPGQRLNTQAEDEPIRVDEEGRLWFQEEVRKPAYPKPRGRRVLKYLDTGVQKQTVQNGEYIETFEVAGQGPARSSEVKITLPSYQVGIYKDPRFPFRIHCYGDREGFDFFEVNDYYGGAELVPDMCKRIYIENDLCYDIRSVIRAIQNEYRQLQLMGKVQ